MKSQTALISALTMEDVLRFRMRKSGVSAILGSRMRTVRFNIALKVGVVNYAMVMVLVWTNQSVFVRLGTEVLDVMSWSVKKKIAMAEAHVIRPRVYAHAKTVGEATPAR